MCPSVPRPSETGVLKATVAPQRGLCLAACADFRQEGAQEEVEVSCALATYNCLTCASVLQRENLDFQFHAESLCVVGLQETRSDPLPRSASANFHILSGPSENGQLGCQLWLARHCPVGFAGREPVYWNPSSFSILSAAPRHLLATASAAGLKFAFLVAHALTAHAGPVAIREWWQQLSTLVGRIPPQHALVILVDANAHFEWSPLPPDVETALNANAKEFASFLREHCLSASPNVTAAGKKVESWLGPMGRPRCLDYVVVPASTAAGMRTQGDLHWFSGHCEHDHKPVKVSIAWCQAGALPKRRPRWDTKAMTTAEGRARLRAIYDSAPTIGWDVDVDTHLKLINQHLHDGLSKAFPCQPAAARSKVISDGTWTLVHVRRRLRKQLFSQRTTCSRMFLARFFRAWRGSRQHKSPSMPDIHLARLHEGFLGLQIRALSRLIARHSKVDVAQAARDTLNTARQRGPEELYRVIRQTMRQGRRYKPPALKPALARTSDGAVDSTLALGMHFAKAERAETVSLDTLTTASIPLPVDPLEVSSALSVPQLAQAYAGLQTGRAPGVTGLPCEAYAGDALGAASVHGPLLLKVQLQGAAPALWRGGRAAPIPKPGKSLACKEGWRSVLLHEASMKGVCKLLRPPLLACLERVRTQGQGGSRPGNPLQAPMAAARGFARGAKAAGVSAGLLFVDARNAFYAVARQLLTGREAGDSSESLCQLGNMLFEDEEERFAFTLAATGPGILASCGVDPAVRRLITSMLQETWFTVSDECSTHLFLTRTGTAPGSPTADVLFQILFSRAMAQLEKHVQEAAEAVQKQVHRSATDIALCHLPAPSWMDDLALPLLAASPEALLELAMTTVHKLDCELRQLAVSLNLDRGKTELLPLVQGRGSRKLRQQWFCRQGAQFAVQLRPDRQELVALTDSYVHLGAVIDSSCADLPDISRRARLAHDKMPGLKRLFRNEALTWEERVHILCSIPMATFKHGSGLWVLDGAKEEARYTAAYYEVPRRVFRHITGLSVRGATNEMLCNILGIASAEETRLAEVVRHLGWIWAERSSSLEALWLCGGKWHQDAVSAVSALATIVGFSGVDPWQALQDCPCLAGKWARRFLKICRRRHLESRDQCMHQLRSYQLALHHGALFLHLPAPAQAQQALNLCPTCGVCFTSSAACASHQRKVHGVVARATKAAVGSRCPVCLVEFWSTKRLRDHLRRCTGCLEVVEAAGLDPEEPISAPVGLRMPAIKAPGPLTWWATLRPQETAMPPSTAVCPWQQLLKQFVDKARSGRGELQSTACSIVERRAFQQLSEEDWPVLVHTLPRRLQDLVRVLTTLCDFVPEPSSSTFAVGDWMIFCKAERILVWPTTLAGLEDGSIQLPPVWAGCVK